MINIKRSIDFILTIVLLISLLFTTIVYSAFNTQLQIRGEAIVRSDQTIRITDFKLIETTNDAYETYNSKYEKDTTSLSATLPASSKMTYEVTITNKNDTLMYNVKEILQLVNNNTNIDIVYNIKPEDYINANDTKTFTIVLTNNTSSVQTLSLINQYNFEVANWIPLETTFLSPDDTGDLAVNKDGVIFEFSVTNLNSYNVTYLVTADNARFTIKDESSDNNTFQIKPNETLTHKVRIILRDDVTYEKYSENLKLMLQTSSPISDSSNVKTVTLALPKYFKAIILNSMPIKDSPKNFTSIEATNGYLLRINDMSSTSYTYYYRGVINNNYVLFSGYLWRVVRIDSNGNVRVVLNDNVSSGSTFSKDYSSNNVETIEQAISLVDYKKSDVKKAVETWYSENITLAEESQFVVNSNFCIDLDYEEPIETQDDHTVYYFAPYLSVGRDSNSFYPDFTCSKEDIYTGHVGLLSAEEILAAGAHWGTLNTSYYLYNPDITESQTSWTMSASYYSISEKQAGVIVYNQDEGSLFDWVRGGNLAQNYGYRPVISLNGNVKVVGDGTKDNPYQIFN